MNILIVHAHHEPKSFCSALKDRAVDTLTRLGHTVEVSDLYAMGFDPVSDRRNFMTVKNPSYLKQQQEELYATEQGSFVPELAAEMEKVLRCDLMIFNFPLWWFALPAILKGWVDRVFAMGKMYGNSLFYENGIGQGKHAFVTMTLGGAPAMFDGYGINPSMKTILQPIQHGIFGFTGFTPLPAFLVHGPARMTDEERVQKLEDYGHFLAKLEALPPVFIPSMDQFDGFMGTERSRRWMVEVKRVKEPDARFQSLLAAESAQVREWERTGKVLASSFARPDDPDWIGWLLIREQTRENVEALLETLPLRPYLRFAIHEAIRS